ncbi:hypothetical protein NK6_8806 [Bradyrhizobium diazoefficiens]|uniref:Uncharacterized protein n=1 Tax=Bradyrhizobium diazoefficiens TaxID=1355477 RepID=A0A0E4FY40_9BRAD|nr:hypothetical protein NK6_8806 [Bradyrhizobium diazoefficiens]
MRCFKTFDRLLLLAPLMLVIAAVVALHLICLLFG